MTHTPIITPEKLNKIYEKVIKSFLRRVVKSRGARFNDEGLRLINDSVNEFQDALAEKPS
jgi:hypothetical protein